MQENVLSRARWCCGMYHYHGSGTLTVVIIRDEAKKKTEDKRNKKKGKVALSYYVPVK